jgi:3-oxoacyl-[acyl-carrier protein] reductase
MWDFADSRGRYSATSRATTRSNVRPESRGRVRSRATNPHPIRDPNGPLGPALGVHSHKETLYPEPPLLLKGMNRFKGKVALVTGSSRGIGRALTLAYAREGADVIINYVRSRDKAEEVAASVKEIGAQALVVQADVTREDQVRAMATEALEKFGKIDILVNNAGYYEDAAVWKMEAAVWDRVLGVNLKGTFLCTKAVAPKMRERNYGRILNISSVVGQIGIFGTSNYTAAKAGVLGFTKSVAKELVNKGITVNALALGYFDTGMFRALPAEVQQKIEGEIPLGRPGTMDEVAEPALFLTSEGASYITGQILHLNGGYYM